MNARTVLLLVVVISVWTLAACNWTIGDCYPVGERTSGAGAGPGDTVDLGLTWQALAAPSSRYTEVISLVDSETKRVVVRRETEPADGTRPTTGWSNGEYVVDNHRVRTSRDLPSGRYRVRIDLVERDSGRYLLSANGSA